MNDFEDPLDLLEDDGDGVIEMCLLDEENKKSNGGNNNSGCSIVLLVIGASVLGITKLLL